MVTTIASRASVVHWYQKKEMGAGHVGHKKHLQLSPVPNNS